MFGLEEGQACGGIIDAKGQTWGGIIAVCHMNTNFTQTAGQVAHKSYLPCVVRATDIAMEGNNKSLKSNLSTRQVTKYVASPVQNELVIGLEDKLLLIGWIIGWRPQGAEHKMKTIYTHTAKYIA